MISLLRAVVWLIALHTKRGVILKELRLRVNSSWRLLTFCDLTQEQRLLRNQFKAPQARFALEKRELDKIARPYTTGQGELLSDLRLGGGNIRALPRAAAALELPWMSAAQREELWTATRQVARRLHKQTREADERDDAGHRTSTPPQDCPSR